MSSPICQLEHRYRSEFAALPDDQSSSPRHKCCGCAYEQGLIDGEARRPHNPKVDSWPESQAGSVRHKSALAAYESGYVKGLAVA